MRDKKEVLNPSSFCNSLYLYKSEDTYLCEYLVFRISNTVESWKVRVAWQLIAPVDEISCADQCG